MKRTVWFALALLCLTPAYRQTPATRGYYRMPAIRGETIVFTAEGDLWTVGLRGGTARRLTSDADQEGNATISPDGATLAFAARYDGPPEIYTMPLAGGVPVRHTWEGANALPVGWTPDGKILYFTAAASTLPAGQLATLDPT